MTMDAAVTYLLQGMPDDRKNWLACVPEDQIKYLHHGWGTAIRDDFGMWAGNKVLIQSCGALHPDDASMKIIKTVWERLQADRAEILDPPPQVP